MITSTSNPRIKEVIQLQKKSRYRKEKSLYIVEGIKMFLEADKAFIKEVFVSESFLMAHKDVMASYQYETVSDNVMKTMSDTVTPQGILCIMKRFNHSLEHMLKNDKPKLLLLSDLQDPGNAGTIIRSAEGAGMDGVILSPDSVDLYNPKTIRSTMGSIYRVPFLYEELEIVIEMLKKKKIPVYTTDMNGSSYKTVNYDKGFAIIIGNEANGVSEKTAALADRIISIPMCGKVESLNASVAASLLMYEACYSCENR